MAGFAWFTVLFVLFIVISFVINLWAFIQQLIPTWLATLNLAVLTYFAYTPLHEAVHGNIHGKHSNYRWLNDLCGYMVAPLIGVSYVSHKYEHLTHHGHLNKPDKDPDLVVRGMHKGWMYILPLSLKFLWVQNQFYAKYHWHKTPTIKRIVYCLELVLSIGWRFSLLLIYPSVELTIVIILGFFIGGMFTAYWFAFRPHYPNQSTERYRDSATLIIPTWLKPLEWFWLGQNYHTVHHLFPRVPFYHYKKVHHKILPALRAFNTPMVNFFGYRK